MKIKTSLDKNKFHSGQETSSGEPTCQALYPRTDSREAGYILVGVIFMVALVVLSLAIAAPRIAASIQRDREVELVHRGDQYKRAIRLYYKKFGSYPNSIDQLEKTNNIRYLRKRYLDPLTGKDDWKLIHMGQAHVRPLGFFGQQLGVGRGIAGASSVGGGSSGAGLGAGGILGASSSSSFGGTSTGSSFGSGGSTGSSFGSGGGLGSTGNSLGGNTGAVGGAAGGGLYAVSADDGTGSGTSGTGSATSSGTSLGAGTTTSTTLGGGNSNSAGFGAATSTTLGGAPVVGVMPPITKASILQYKLKTNYKDWEFVYDPVEEQTAAGSILGGTGNINANGNSLNGPGGSSTGTAGGLGLNSGTGSGSTGAYGGSSSFGSSSGSSSSGSSGSAGQTGTTPQ